jgi:hypothetical protein
VNGEPRNIYRPILYRWAFMDYAVTSPQRELRDTGRAVFQGGELNPRDGQMSLTSKAFHFTALAPEATHA